MGGWNRIATFAENLFSLWHSIGEVYDFDTHTHAGAWTECVNTVPYGHKKSEEKKMSKLLYIEWVSERVSVLLYVSPRILCLRNECLNGFIINLLPSILRSYNLNASNMLNSRAFLDNIAINTVCVINIHTHTDTRSFYWFFCYSFVWWPMTCPSFLFLFLSCFRSHA